MTDAAVLESVINKAHSNGYKFSWDDLNHMNMDVLTPQVIFDHSFAKALWRDDEWEWQKYLQQLVLAPNRIEYLKQFIEKT